MSSPDLLNKQIQRWTEGQRSKSHSSVGDVELMRKEVIKLNSEEDRYNKAYGSGLFSIEQLKAYTQPIRDRISGLESQILKVEQFERELNATTLPDEKEIKVFAEKTAEVLKNLKFESKKEIVKNVIDKVIGTREYLQVYGHIPVTNINVFTSYRNCGSPKRR